MKISDFKCYVINLDRRPDRLEEFRKAFEPLGLPEIERFAAVDGAEGVPDEWKPRDVGGWGCLRSHWLVVQKAYDEGVEYLMVFEDDADPLFPADQVADQLQKTLDELPANWEMFYPGCEHLRGNIGLPYRITEHLVVPYNANRTHSYALTRAGMKKVLAKCEDWKNWVKWWHIDWAFGDLHERREIKVYCAYPPIFGQAAGMSDINPIPKVPAMHWRPFNLQDFRIDGAAVTDEKVGYGKFDKRVPVGFDAGIYDGFFAHAPSVVEVDVTKPVELFAAHGTKEGGWCPSAAVVDGETIGEVCDKGETTKTVTLEPGTHKLEFRTDDNRAAHTFWMFRPLDRLPYQENATFEIFSNAKCPRHCPHCNQQKTMAANSSYEYTAEDAEALVNVLTRPIRVIFSGGEPSKLGVRKWNKILDTFRDSGKVSWIAVTTSDDSEKWITYAGEKFDKIHFSHRPSMGWGLYAPPGYIRNNPVEVWNADTHSPWPTERFEGLPACCCTMVGDHAAIFGQEVFPCILGKEMATRLPGSVPGPVPLADYFTGKKAFAPIGYYEACRWCVNNHLYRIRAKQTATD